MKAHKIIFNNLSIQGKMSTEIINNNLKLFPGAINNRFDKFISPIKSYVLLPRPYSLPLRIDIVAKLDSPALYLLVGKGHITFGSSLYEDNRTLRDIAVPDLKPKRFNNTVSFNEYNNFSVTFGKDFMQILVNNEQRYLSDRQKYMKKSVYEEVNETGVNIGLSCNQMTDIHIKYIKITEYEDDVLEPIETINAESIPLSSNSIKHTFDSIITNVLDKIKSEIISINDYLLNSNKLKFRRQIDKNGHKITYLASKEGFSYSMHISNNVVFHSLWFYIVTNSKPEKWHRKNDRMIDTLMEIEKADKDLAEELFSRLDMCVNCYGNHCKAKTKYELNGKKKTTCHGKMMFKMTPEDFKQVKLFIDTFLKIADGLNEKIFI